LQSPSRMRACMKRLRARSGRLERDLALARELQMRLLPQTLPKLANLELAAKFVPARAIGGDLYDFNSLFAFAPGNCNWRCERERRACRHLHAALVSGILRSHAPIEPGPAEMLRAVKSLASRAAASKRNSSRSSTLYGTMHIGHFWWRTRACRVPFHVHAGKNHVIEATGLPLGLFRRCQLR